MNNTSTRILDELNDLQFEHDDTNKDDLKEILKAEKTRLHQSYDLCKKMIESTINFLEKQDNLNQNVSNFIKKQEKNIVSISFIDY